MRLALATVLAVSIVACAKPADELGERQDPATSGDSTAHLAHDAYTAAINSNNVDSMMTMFTDDVIFLTAHSAPVIGKAAVRSWIEGYVGAYTTHWDKTANEFVVSGDYAYERYTYKSTDTPKAGGAVVEDTGWGVIVWHRDADGKWRVARDAFASDRPLPTN